MTSYTSANFQDKNVGTGKTVNVSGISISGTDSGNYTANTTATTTADITARSLTVTATGINKVYDGTTNATVTLSDNRVSGDVLSTSYTSASFEDKSVGTGKTVNVSGISISGTDSGNYTPNITATTTADITARSLTVSATGINKVYDGTTNATVTLSDNRVSGDVLSTSYTSASFVNKNVGTGKTVNVSGISISGTDSGNYTANTTATTTADITARSLTVSATGVNKVYDGTTNATVTLSDNRLSGDVLTLNYSTASFVNKNVGTGKTVNVSGISISGTDSGNYTANTTATTTADITARSLTVSATGINKVYDGTTNATVTLSDNRVSGDVLMTSYTSASFQDKNVGTGKTVNVSGISISGTDSSNYTFNTTATTTADITGRSLTVTATASSKVYDGTTNASVTLSDNRLSGDVLTTSYTGAGFANKNVGTNKTVTVVGISISGADSGNYTANTTTTTTADITARSLTVTATGVNKVYDGTTNATVTLSDNRVSGDVLTTSYTSASFADKNVGTNKTLTVTGISISGTDSGNYTANTTATTTANITARSLTVSATGVNKVYDGTTNATVTLSDNRVSGDVLTTSYTSASFANKNVGTGKTVSVSGISVSGADSGNYTFNTTTTTTADISARSLTVTATGVNKVYDGTTNATVTLSDNRVSGDVLTTSYTSASFANKNVGTNKTVNVAGISISGTDAGNYSANTTASTTADITARPLTIGATGVNKVYDGTTNATVTLSDDRVSGDVLTTSYTSASFTDPNVGTNKTVNVSGISISGTDSGNYTFNTTASTTANITRVALTVSADNKSRAYGVANPSLTASYTGFVSGEDESVLSGSPDISTAANAGSPPGNYAIMISQGSLSAANYSFTFSNGVLTVSCGTIALSPGTLSGGTAGSAYSQTISASGGAAPYTFAMLSGSLPGGLSLSSGGSLSGTPTASGNFNFSITATDTNGCLGTQGYSLTISCPAISLSTNLANATAGVAYNQTVTATNGTAPYSFSVSNGTLPNGLSLDSATGVISGTPTNLNTYNFDIVATDAYGCSGSQSYSITVNCGTLVLSPATLPDGSTTTSYSTTVVASGGVSPYTFAITSGGLPAGLSLSSGGAITGSPSEGTNAAFTITATDVNGCNASSNYTIQITTPGAPPDGIAPLIKVISPTSKQEFTTNQIVAYGTAKDNTQVASVKVRGNGGAFVTASLVRPTPTSAAWTNLTMLATGTNVLDFKASDPGGSNTTKTLLVFLKVTNTVTIAAIGNGTGTITPVNLMVPGGILETPTNGAALDIGRDYKLSLVPAAGSLLSNVLSVVDGVTNVAYSAGTFKENQKGNTKFTFRMQTNLTLLVNFVTNRFVAAAGNYYGLFSDPNGVAHQSSGFFKIKTTSTQKFTGKIYVEGEPVSISGVLSLDGLSTLKKIPTRKGLTNVPINVSLAVNLVGDNTMTGTVSTVSWTADLAGYRGVYEGTTNSPSTLGNYTMILPGTPGNATKPGGDGFQLLSLITNGIVKSSGTSSEGLPLKPLAASVFTNGDWPFYAALYVTNRVDTNTAKNIKTYLGSVMGWINFNGSEPTGDLFWNKGSWSNGFYNAGFTNQITVIGSLFTNVPATSNVIDITSGSVTLNDGNLSPGLTNEITYAKAKMLATLPNPNGIKLAISSKGALTGKLVHPDNALIKTAIKGAVLQNQAVARGVFKGTNQTGSILIQGN